MIYGYGDLDISIAMGGKPVITIGHDGKCMQLVVEGQMGNVGLSIKEP